MLKILQEKHFKNDVKKYKNNIKVQQLVNDVILKLCNGETLDKKHKNHQLKGQWFSSFDCYV